MLPDYYGQRGFEIKIDPYVSHDYMRRESKSAKLSAQLGTTRISIPRTSRSSVRV